MNKKSAQTKTIYVEEKDSGLILDISDIANKPSGASVSYSLNGAVCDFNDKDIKLKSGIEGKVSIMKIEEEYNVALKNIELTLEKNCDKCLIEFDYKMTIPFAEKQYLISDEKFDNRFDFFYADTKTHKIDIQEFLRQEIILHFPLVTVCSPHCNGIN